jgi:transposase
MQSGSKRRTHGAELKATVIAECERPGASVSAVSLAHGLNANLVRSWLGGRGLKRAGLASPSTIASQDVPPCERSQVASAPLQFVPMELAAARTAQAVDASSAEVDIQIELRWGNLQLTVRWPSSQAGSCAAWLRELATGALK